MCARGRVYVWDQRVKIYPTKRKKGTWKNSLKLTSEKSEVLRFVLPAAHKKRKEKKQLRLSFHHQMQQSTKLFWTCFIVWSFYNYPLTFSHESHLDWAENQSNEGKTWKWAKPAANYVIATISHFFEEKSWAKAEKPKTWKQNTFVRTEEWEVRSWGEDRANINEGSAAPGGPLKE